MEKESEKDVEVRCKTNCDIVDLYVMFDQGGMVLVHAGDDRPKYGDQLGCMKVCLCTGYASSRPQRCVFDEKDLPRKFYITIAASNASRNVVLKVKSSNLDTMYTI